jgi:hypothetical protein
MQFFEGFVADLQTIATSSQPYHRPQSGAESDHHRHRDIVGNCLIVTRIQKC